MNIDQHNLLYYFFKTAQTGSLTAASKECGLTQPTLSVKIKSLEQKLNAKLFHRKRSGMGLTPEGLRIFESCQEVFSRMEDVLSPIIDKKSSLATLKIGTSFSVAPHEILRIKRVIEEKIPDVFLRISSHSWEELRQKLERRQIDLAICDSNLNPEPLSLYKSALLSRSPVYFVAAHSLRTKRPSFPQVLKEAPFLLRAPGNPIRLQLESWLKKMRITPQIKVEVEDPELIRAMALEGDGIVAINPLNIKEDLQRGRLKKLHPKPLGLYADTWLIAHKMPLGGNKIISSINACFNLKRKSLLHPAPIKR